MSDGIEFVLDDARFRILVRVTAQDGSTRDYSFGVFARQAEVGFEDTALTVDEDVPQADADPQAANARVDIRVPGMREAAGGLTYAAGDTDPADLDSDLGTSRPVVFSIADGDEGTAAVDIPIAPDEVNEAHETFTVTLEVSTLQAAATGVTAKDDAKTVTVTITDNDPPAAPASFALTRRNERLVATWTKPAGPVASYQLQYKTQDAPDMRVPAATRDDPATGWRTLGLAGTATRAEITGLKPGTAYVVRVRATDGQEGTGNGYGPWSTSPPTTPRGWPALPRDLAVTPGNGRLDLSWTAPPPPVTGYQLDYRVQPDGQSGFVGNVWCEAAQTGMDASPADGWVAEDRGTESDPPATTQTIDGLENGKKYMLRLRAVNGEGTAGCTNVDPSRTWVLRRELTPTDTRPVLTFGADSATIMEGEDGTLTAKLESGRPRATCGPS